jgi:hypothetical protein
MRWKTGFKAFAFKCNLYRYSAPEEVAATGGRAVRAAQRKAAASAVRAAMMEVERLQAAEDSARRDVLDAKRELRRQGWHFPQHYFAVTPVDVDDSQLMTAS